MYVSEEITIANFQRKPFFSALMKFFYGTMYTLCKYHIK